MYYDLCMNYNKTFPISKSAELCELIASAICDEYKFLTINIIKKGIINNSISIEDNFFDIDLKSLYNTFSIKFINSDNLIDLDEIKILKRLTLEISDAKEIFQLSNPIQYFKYFDILAVLPKNEKMFEACLNELNIDLIQINFEEKINFPLKKHQINTAIEKNMFFEIIYSDFIKQDNKRSIFISNVLLLLEVTKGKNIIISSGAESFYDHRSPYDVITIFETIFNIKDAKRMISDNCESLILKSIQRKFYKTVIKID